MVCFGKIIVELKTQDSLSGKEEAQVLNYLKATGIKVGVVINFGSHPKLEWKRLVFYFLFFSFFSSCFVSFVFFVEIIYASQNRKPLS